MKAYVEGIKNINNQLGMVISKVNSYNLTQKELEVIMECYNYLEVLIEDSIIPVPANRYDK